MQKSAVFGIGQLPHALDLLLQARAAERIASSQHGCRSENKGPPNAQLVLEDQLEKLRSDLRLAQGEAADGREAVRRAPQARSERCSDPFAVV